MDLENELKEALKVENIAVGPDESLQGRVEQMVRQGCSVQSGRMQKKWVGFRWKAAVAFVCVVVLAGFFQFPAVRNSAGRIVNYFNSSVKYKMGESEDSYSYHEMYVSISKRAPKNDTRFATMAEVEQATGVDLLQAAGASEGCPCIEYTPYMSDKEQLNGFMIINDYYDMGDLKNVVLEPKENPEDIRCEYEVGEKYKSPVTMQATVRSNHSSGVDYKDHELEYSGRIFDLTHPDVTDVTLYPAEKLGIKAVIARVKSDGRPGKCLSDYRTTSVSVAFFVYHGIEYIYIGDMEQDAMKQFIDGLEE